MTQAGVERIRGVDSDYTLRSPAASPAVVELGRRHPGRPILYGTGFEFLERFGLRASTTCRRSTPRSRRGLAEGAGEPVLAVMTRTTPRRRSAGRSDDGRGSRRSRPGLMPAERIQKVLAAAGVASRARRERLVAAGRVTVDGRPATLGQKVDPTMSTIEVDGRAVGVGAAARPSRALHKPAGVTSTTRDRHATTTVLDLVPTALSPAAPASIRWAASTRTPRG